MESSLSVASVDGMQKLIELWSLSSEEDRASVMQLIAWRIPGIGSLAANPCGETARQRSDNVDKMSYHQVEAKCLCTHTVRNQSRSS